MTIIDNHVRIRVDDTPFYYYLEVQTDVIDDSIVDPANPTAAVSDFIIEESIINKPTAVAAGLDITVNVGSAIVNDVTSIVADPDDTKFALVSVVRDDGTGILEIQVQEKVLGNYASTPTDKTWECDIQEFSVIANGSNLVAV